MPVGHSTVRTGFGPPGRKRAREKGAQGGAAQAAPTVPEDASRQSSRVVQEVEVASVELVQGLQTGKAKDPEHSVRPVRPGKQIHKDLTSRKGTETGTRWLQGGLQSGVTL